MKTNNKRKSNVVEAPTLFVGVGGIGSDIVLKVHDYCSKEETENISFVCMDTNVNDIKELHADDKGIVAVQTSSTQTVGSFLDNDEDASFHWFPNNEVIFGKTVSEGAGQLRAISRLAFNATIKKGNLAPLFKAIDDLFKKSGQDMKQALRCCVVSSASGGTGSGMVLPFCMFIRDYVNEKYPNASVILRTMLVLPETLDSVIKSNIEKDSQRRNAYATIKEFNAFMMKGSGFCNIDDELKRYNDLHIDVTVPGRDELKSLSCLPCDFCFLIDGQDAEDATSNSLEQYKEQAAIALYEQNVGPMQKKAFSIEDNIIKELSNPGNHGRNRFGGIGAGRIIYPYEKIADYIAYDWAKEAVGEGKDAGAWLYCDKRIEEEEEKARAKGESLSLSEEQIYVESFDNRANTNDFYKQMKAAYNLDIADTKITNLITEIKNDIKKAVGKNTKLKEFAGLTTSIRDEEYCANVENWQNLAGDVQDMTRYATTLDDVLPNLVINYVNGVIRNDESTINLSEKKGYLESIFRSGENICHPNAARYMLCKLYLHVNEKQKKNEAEIQKTYNAIQEYETLDNQIHLGKKVLASMTDLCNALQSASINSKKKKDKQLVNDLKAHTSNIADLYSSIDKYKNLLIDYNINKAISENVHNFLKEYKKFYKKFAEKCRDIEKKQQDILDEIKFHKGDTVRNVCADKMAIDGLSSKTNSSKSKARLLSAEVNATFFDDIKHNAEIARENSFQSVVFETDKRKDLFDDTLIGYYKTTVRNDCKEIDMNIIEAILTEHRYKIAKDTLPNDDGKVIVNPNAKESRTYVEHIIKIGENISAPGIQRIIGEEPREINVCAYNPELLKLNGDIRIKEVLPMGVCTETVPKNELHYFNALYNITPDKLQKFKAPKVTGTGKKVAGLYHDAYSKYTRDIGPDCTKSSKMSTHIDRRWDSIAAMPELDLEYQHKQFLRMHKAFVYGLVFGLINKENYVDGSAHVQNPAQAYRYRNTNNRYEDMIVSNGTLCDEFYEILDAMYCDRSLVENIYKHEAENRFKQSVKKVDFEKSIFNEEYLSKFELRDKPASLLQIPIEYYVSLPNKLKDDEEISTLVDAVIEVLFDQIKILETEKNAKFILCDLLKKQYDKLKANLYLYQDKVDPKDSKILDEIEYKIKDVFESTPQPDNYEETLKSIMNRNEE